MLLYKQITSLNKTQLKKMLHTFLKEDVPTQDHTTQAVILKNEKGQYIVRSREQMVFCGAPIIENAFSNKIQIKQLIKDGEHIPKNTEIAQIEGSVIEILKKEWF
jgi:nicotinate-nucleotide pyrophosphorylase (carboxylating)